ncbi:MAG: tetratricopeptide repeat protein, partial [Candidatus Bathyarchaeia archaeon]
WLGPRLPALYHQEQGARLLARALMAEGRGEEGGLWLEPEPLTRSEARSLATQALAQLETAVAADPGNFQAHRWLGRAALLLDRPEEAIVAFSAAARLRPANPLAWWDLGLAYERLAPAPVFPESGDMNAPALAPDSRPVIPDNTGAKPALIPAASVEVPPIGIPDSNLTATDYPLPPTGYIQWRMPDAPDAWPGWWVPSDPVRRSVLFAAVPATLTFQVSLPVTPTALIFWMGMDPLLQSPQGDGVVYRVWVENAEVFSHTLWPEDALQGWWPAQVDLTSWAGQTVRLTLTLDPGPAGDTTGDWAGWGDLQLVPANTARCWLASCRERAAAAWRKGGFTAQDFIQAGEAARKAKRYEEALRWYGRATWMEPGLADPWYYAGLAYEGMERWKEALTVYERAIAMGLFVGVHLSSPYYRMGVIYQWRLEPRQVDAALAAYETAITLNDFNDDWEASDAHHKRGEIFLWLNDAEEAIHELKMALDLDTHHPHTHILLGIAYYIQNNIAMAQIELQEAMRLEPHNPWAPFHLGDIYFQEGNLEEACLMYVKALKIAPDFEIAQDRVHERCGRLFP